MELEKTRFRMHMLALGKQLLQTQLHLKPLILKILE